MAARKRLNALRRIKAAYRRLPPAGRYYLLSALALLGIGVHRNINLMMLLGYAMLVLAVCNVWAAGRTLRGLRAQRRLGEWLFACTPRSIEIQVSNPSRRARWGIRIEDHEPGTTSTRTIEQLPARGSVNWRREIVLPNRGKTTWRALEACSGYPFGLFERRVQLIPPQDVIVLPSLGWMHRGRFLRYLRNLSVQPQYVRVRRLSRPQPAAQAEFHGLRAFQSGDSPRLIHWRTSARCGQLMVREFEDELSDNLLLVLDPTLPPESDYAGVPLREQFEEAVSLTATICWEWCRRRGDRLILATGGPRPVVMEGLTGPSHARRILESLALLECCAGPADPAVVSCLAERILPSCIVVLIALGASPLDEPLREELGRPVNYLDAALSDCFDFYSPP